MDDEIVTFFEMMTERARNGEFRFMVCSTIGADDNVRVSIGGIATDEEAYLVSDCIEEEIERGEGTSIAGQLH